MNDAELIARAREGSRRPTFYYGCQGCADALLDELADALARHSAPLPADVAGLVEELTSAAKGWREPAKWPGNFQATVTLTHTTSPADLYERAASLIASQARGRCQGVNKG